MTATEHGCGGWCWCWCRRWWCVGASGNWCTWHSTQHRGTGVPVSGTVTAPAMHAASCTATVHSPAARPRAPTRGREDGNTTAMPLCAPRESRTSNAVLGLEQATSGDKAVASCCAGGERASIGARDGSWSTGTSTRVWKLRKTAIVAASTALPSSSPCCCADPSMCRAV